MAAYIIVLAPVVRYEPPHNTVYQNSNSRMLCSAAVTLVLFHIFFCFTFSSVVHFMIQTTFFLFLPSIPVSPSPGFLCGSSKCTACSCESQPTKGEWSHQSLDCVSFCQQLVKRESFLLQHSPSLDLFFCFSFSTFSVFAQ